MTIHTEMKLINKRELRDIISIIESFSDDCAEAEYTDIGDVWTVLHNIRARLITIAA